MYMYYPKMSEEILDSLELQLYTTLDDHVDAESQIWLL